MAKSKKKKPRPVKHDHPGKSLGLAQDRKRAHLNERGHLSPKASS